MKKHIFHLLFLALIFNSCIINDFVLDDVSFNFNLTNYTNKSWDEGTLYVGAKNKQGDFIATDSIKIFLLFLIFLQLIHIQTILMALMVNIKNIIIIK
tara:strand:- start:1359 stop:1652 length:294 start_codon:yes stop_codon:yes gene_type:complete